MKSSSLASTTAHTYLRTVTNVSSLFPSTVFAALTLPQAARAEIKLLLRTSEGIVSG